jgi:hypothetical protein
VGQEFVSREVHRKVQRLRSTYELEVKVLQELLDRGGILLSRCCMHQRLVAIWDLIFFPIRDFPWTD